MKIRETARVLIRDPHEQVLLIQSADPRDLSVYSWWLPGGGIEAGEQAGAAAKREALEETGLTLSGLRVVCRHELWMTYQGRGWLQSETIFTARVGEVDIRPARPTEIEKTAHLAYRWWTGAELVTTTALVLPRRLPEILDHLRCGMPGGPLVLRDESFRDVR